MQCDVVANVMSGKHKLGAASRDFIDISKRSSVYFLGQTSTKSIGLLLIPLFTRFLIPSDYGILAAVSSLAGVLSIIYTLGLRASFARFYWDYKDDHREMGEFFTTVLSFVTLVSVLCTVLLLVFGERPFAVIMRDVPFDPYIKMGLLLALFQVFTPFWTTLCRAREKSMMYVLFTGLSFLSASALSVCLVVFLNQGALGRLRGQVFVQGAFAVLALVLLGREAALRVSLTKLRDALRYGLPFVPHNLSGWIMSLLDRLILGGYEGYASVGIYNVGYALGGAMGTIAVAFNLAYTPYFMKKFKEQGDQAGSTVARVATLWTIALIFLALLITVFSWEIVHVMTVESYYGASTVVPIITLAFLCQGLYFVAVKPLIYSKKYVRYLPIGSLSGGALNILGNFLLIPTYGMLGAAWSTAISYFVMFILAHVIARKAVAVPYEYSKIGKGLLIGVVLFGLAFGIDQFQFAWWARAILKLAVVISYLPLLLIFNVFDWRRIRRLLADVCPWSKRA